jgi:hypothetical protein
MLAMKNCFKSEIRQESGSLVQLMGEKSDSTQLIPAITIAMPPTYCRSSFNLLSTGLQQF